MTDAATSSSIHCRRAAIAKRHAATTITGAVPANTSCSPNHNEVALTRTTAATSRRVTSATRRPVAVVMRPQARAVNIAAPTVAEVLSSAVMAPSIESDAAAVVSAPAMAVCRRRYKPHAVASAAGRRIDHGAASRFTSHGSTPGRISSVTRVCVNNPTEVARSPTATNSVASAMRCRAPVRRASRRTTGTRQRPTSPEVAARTTSSTPSISATMSRTSPAAMMSAAR